jgi:hypothetical protein
MNSVKVHPTDEWNFKGSKLEQLPPTPLRGLLLGPSGSGKTVVLVDLILRMYRGSWERIFIFSPSVNIDSAWQPVKDYVEKTMGIDTSKEQCFFDEWDTGALADIVETQRKITAEMKKQKVSKQLYGILIVVDDFADDPRIMHSSGGAASGGSMLNTLFIRGRHMGVSTLVSSQKLRLVSSTIRVNLQFMLIWRLRNRMELQSLLEEISAVYPVKTLNEMYDLAVSDPYSFWYILFTAKRREDMFYLRFEQRMIPQTSATDKDGSLDNDDPEGDALDGQGGR